MYPIPRERASCDPLAVRRLVRQLAREGRQLKLTYEAGPTRHVLQHQLTQLGVECQRKPSTSVFIRSCAFFSRRLTLS